MTGIVVSGRVRVDRRLSLVFIVAVAMTAVVASWAASSARADDCSADSLTLAPPTQTHIVGQTATVTATLDDGCGQPVHGATVDFSVLSGPDVGTNGGATADANGQASFSYRGLTAGTDTLDATVTNPAGTITSNTVNVIWLGDADLALANVPGNITTSATGPSGAVVTYTPPTATDEGGETPPVVCLPGSGSLFVIGTTTVTCTATDTDDANSPVTATFTVTVNGALAQLQDPLLSDVRAIPASIGRLILVNDVNGMIHDLQAGRTATVCSDLTFMELVVQEWSGALMTTAQGNTILADVNQISAVLGCNTT